MGIVTITLPDVGEGIAEAELSEWNVEVGDHIREDDVLGTVMTDKAAVEIPSALAGKVVWRCGEPGDTIAIGADFIKLEVDGAGEAEKDAPATPAEEQTVPGTEVAPTGSGHAEPCADDRARQAGQGKDAGKGAAPGTAQGSDRERKGDARLAPGGTLGRSAVRTVPLGEGERPAAAPSVRQRAREAGIDLRLVAGSGPGGRISQADLEAFLAQGGAAALAPSRAPATGTREIKVVGMRRRIAEKMALSKSRIPHITIIEEVDVTALEDLRSALNARHAAERGKLTLLPFVMRAIVVAVAEQPEMNAHFDDAAELIRQSAAVHVGIATQTPAGLTVPVVRHAEALSLWQSAEEISRLAAAAREGKANREELSGSTITITSLGPLGALATTPIINHPEVAIVGINRMATRPLWDGRQFQPRRMMNISCSFDHRVIDGWDAAVFVQKLKALMETPALLFIED